MLKRLGSIFLTMAMIATTFTGVVFAADDTDAVDMTETAVVETAEAPETVEAAAIETEEATEEAAEDAVTTEETVEAAAEDTAAAEEDATVEAAATSFDPETVMWTDNKMEDVLAVDGKYATVKDVDPNASSKTDSGVQSPYANTGSTLTDWAYSEYIWTHYYPIGNGRMAAMVAGGIDNDVIQINEDTCWDGSPYGTLVDESGNTITTMAQAYKAQKITATDMTSGSVKDNWKYFRGANEDGTPAEIGSADAIVGDEEFRTNFPAFANKSISYQALNVDNSKTDEAVQGRYDLESMVEYKFLGNPSGQRAYKSFAEVYLDFGQESANATNYTKSLDMETGIVTVEYDYNGSHYKRDNFASYPDQAVVTHVESDADLDFSAELHTYHNDSGYCTYTKISDNEVKVNAMVTNGNKNNNIGRINVIQFEARMYLDGDGSTFSVSDDNTTVSVKGGKSATIYVVGATNYVDYKTLDNSKQDADCEYYIANIKTKTYDEIKARHLADFTEQYSKSSLSLENVSGVDYSSTPTEERVRKDVSGASGFTLGAGSKLNYNKSVDTTYSEGDNQLATLEFNYGKYLLLSGSRDGQTASGDGEIDIQESQPLNLTGKWNAAMSASWNGKYTININTEMNYWAAQPLSLGDSEKPLIDTFADLAESGAITAEYQYGITNDRGDDTYQPGDPWVMHHNFDLWRGTQPIDNATAGLWPTGGAWLLDHAWQYYQYNKDTEYLAEVYPYMVGAAKFFTQFLVVDPETGYLITAASCSPEQGGVQPGPAMDTQLVRNLYDMVQQASAILGKEEENADLLAKIAEQMPSTYLADEQGKIAPNLIDSSGLIKEWVRGDVTFDLSENSDPTAEKHQNITNPFTGTTVSIKEHTASNNNGHRHCSHLWEIFPGTHLSGYSDDTNEQKIFKAYQKSVSARGSGSGQGWGLAWRINLNARALNADSASAMLEQLFQTRTSPNLFDQHPNFQIDGNYGATSGIIEMVMQSHDGAITLLPAIPDTWAAGSYSGLNTRCGATIDLTWDGGKPQTAVVHATESGDKTIRNDYVGAATVYDESGNVVASSLNDDMNELTFTAEAGKSYTISGFDAVITEHDTVYKATDTTTFYASDGGTTPKLDGDGYSIGYIYNRDGVKIGYAIDEFDFDGLKGASLNMKSVRYDNTYVILAVDSPTGTQIANQVITTGDNELELSNIESFSGKHKLYVLYVQDPYDGDSSHKYLGNSCDLTATYGNSETETTPAPVVTDAPATATPAVTDAPSGGGYAIDKAEFTSSGSLDVALSYSGTEASPAAKLIVAEYEQNNESVLLNQAMYDVEGTSIKNLDYKYNDGTDVKVFLWDGTGTIKPLTEAKSVAAPVIVTAAPATAAPTATPLATAAPTATPLVTAAPTATPDASGNSVTVIQNNATVGTYTTVTEALAAAEALNPSSEDTRVTINIDPGVYREQITVSKPYITMQKTPGKDGETKLTWYYGLGSLYDSCSSSGFYDASVIGDGESYAPKNWGASLTVGKNATAFIANDLYLENSYNAYYTEEELTDITSVDPDTNNGNFKRVQWITDQKEAGVSDDEINAYLQSRYDLPLEYSISSSKASPRERSAALYCSADKAQFYGCTVMSTQDTIGINTGRMYFKNCKLGGTTDYICGSATAVFDSCELYTNAGPKASESATVTAASNSSTAEGYLFWNCKITGSSTATAGSLGRPWGAAPGPAVAYIGTAIGSGLISDKGWSDMSSNKAEDARFAEYGSTDPDGNALDLSKRLSGKVLTEWTMLRYNPYTYTKGTDSWDPAGVASTYTNVDSVLSSTTIDTSDASAAEISLPSAPDGYEFNWESNSEFATVSDDGTKLSLVRPAYGEDPISASVKLYARESANTEVGAEKSITFDIQPTSDTTNVFTVSGTVSLSVADDSDQTVTIKFTKGEAVIKTQTITIPAGQTSVSYSAENIPVGTYTATASISNTEYNIDTDSVSITGTKGQTQTYDINAKKMKTITASVEDISTLNPTITTATGFSAGSYTATGSETANLGDAGNIVYKLSKENGTTVAAKTGVSFDLTKLFASGTTLKNAKTLSVSFDFLMESTDLMPSSYSFFDLATSTSNAGADKADQTRFVRWGVYKGWGQFNMFNASNTRINGDKTQFDKNNTMANRWYRIKADIDLENQVITTTLYDRDKNMEILNGKAFEISDAADEAYPYPTSVDISNLYLNLYMDKGGTSTAMEYYFDNISIEYQDFE